VDRREFLKTGIITGGAVAASALFKNNLLYAARAGTVLYPDLVALRNAAPAAMFAKGIKALGGMNRFVKNGSKVVIKPNVGWNKAPRYGATTNPGLIKEIIKHCQHAGAAKIYVFDHTCDFWKYSYKKSGIGPAVTAAGAQMVPANSESYYESVTLQKGKVLKQTKVHELIIDSDVFINVPVLKHHGSTQATIAMKNLMGVVWDRSFYHRHNLHQCIADFCNYRLPDLNIVDAYTVMERNGPKGVSLDDIVIKKNQLISTDIVAADTAAAKILGRDPDNIGYITKAAAMQLGEKNLRKLNIKKIVF